MMIPVNRDNLRDALIAVAVGATLAWLLSGCAGQPQPPLTTTAAQLTQVATPAPTSNRPQCSRRSRSMLKLPAGRRSMPAAAKRRRAEYLCTWNFYMSQLLFAAAERRCARRF
jgi:Flp pilus assembly protein TadD